MSHFHSLCRSSVLWLPFSGFLLGLSGSASAQGPVPDDQPPAPALPTAPAPPALPAAAAPAAIPGDAPASQEGQGGVDAATPPATTQAEQAAPSAQAYSSTKLEAFVDGYGSLNYNLPKPQVQSNMYRAFDSNNGFSLAWAGVDLSHEAAPVGGTVSLRFGPAARLFAGGGAPGSDSDYGLENLRQAYATYKPWSQLALDVGKFDTIVGAEVHDSQKNFNYTRGLLYWLGQPAFHTGLRVAYQPIDLLSFKLMAVNGWNRSVDNNFGKTFGAQVGVTPSTKFGAYLAWVGGPEQDDVVSCGDGFGYDRTTHTCQVTAGAVAGNYRNDGANKRWRHLIDLVLTANPTDALSLALNGDVGMDKILDAQGNEKSVRWYGAMLGARYAFSQVYAAAVRGEVYRDPDGFTTGAADGVTLGSGTVTLEAKPSSWLILRLENRLDSANHEVFRKGVDGTSKAQFTSLLGVVFTTGHTWEKGK